jgi:Proprotein convertase P-domain
MLSPRARRLCGLVAGAVLAGQVAAAGQTISFPGYPAHAATLGAIPDGPGPGCGTAGPPRDVTFMSPPAAGLVSVGVIMTITHAYAGHLTATLIAPDGTAHVLFGRPGALSASDCGSSGDLNGSYHFQDVGADFWGAAATTGLITPGTYLTSTAGGGPGGGTSVVMSTVFAGKNAGGVWRLRLTDSGAGDTGAVLGATLGVTHPRLNNAASESLASMPGAGTTRGTYAGVE